jgi:hypothetical protein
MFGQEMGGMEHSFIHGVMGPRNRESLFLFYPESMFGSLTDVGAIGSISPNV